MYADHLFYFGNSNHTGILAHMDILANRRTLSIWKTIFLHGIFGLMLVMSWHFFKERLYADSAYYIFHSIDSGSFVTANQRIVLALSEIISLAVYYLGGNLHTILITWSVSHVLFYYLLFIIVYHFHKNEAAGIAIILLQVIGQIWLYYSPMLEICYGAALLVVFSVLLEEKKFTVQRWFWLIILEILVLTSHPENFVLFFFIVMYDILNNGFRKKVHFTFFVLLIVCIIFKTLTFSEYEGGKLGFMLNPDQNHMYENLWNKKYMEDVFGIFVENYKVLFLFLLLATSAILLRRRYKTLLLTYFCAGGLIVLVNATNYAREYTRYNESLYYPVVGLLTMVFMLEFYRILPDKTRMVSFAALICISLVYLNGIRNNGEYLKLRTFQIEEIIRVSRESELKKSMVRMENAERDRWFLNWSYPIETLLLSSLSGPGQTVSVMSDEDFNYRDTTIELTPQRFMLRRWEIREDNDLLPFFNMKTGEYVALNNADTLITDGLLKGKISLDLNVEKSVCAYSKIYFPVEINNNSTKKIPSLPVTTNFFHVEISNESQTSSLDIPFDIDIPEHYTEVVSCPATGINKPWQVSVIMKVGGEEVASKDTVIN